VVRKSPVPYVLPDSTGESGTLGLLDGVDPVGNTAFNARQMRILIDEVTDQINSAQGERRDALIVLVELCREGQRPPHRMLWLLGD
jgi:hypothetical protein